MHAGSTLTSVGSTLFPLTAHEQLNTHICICIYTGLASSDFVPGLCVLTACFATVMEAPGPAAMTPETALSAEAGVFASSSAST